ncbi:MAG: DUF983 domain-containing protein [Cytophagaceae bacterium]
MSVLTSILACKCPKCHQGDLFVYKNPYKISGITKMPENCHYCGQRTEPEVGFYFGSMYVSYGLCVGVSIFIFILTEFIIKLPPYSFMVVNTLALLLLWPMVFRYARVMYLYLFVRHDPDAIIKFHNSKNQTKLN